MALIGFVGLIGSGKTYNAVRVGLAMADRRNAFFASNIWTKDSVPYAEWIESANRHLDDPDLRVPSRLQLSTGEDGFSLDELAQIIQTAKDMGRGLVLLVDEIGLLMPARFWQKFPVNTMYRVSQSRKMRVDFIYTAQDIEDVDAYLRRKTTYVYKVSSGPASSVERQERGKSPWYFLLSRYKPSEVGKKDKREGWFPSVHLFNRRLASEYDTDELVEPPKRLVVAELCANHKKEQVKAECPMCKMEALGETIASAQDG